MKSNITAGGNNIPISVINQTNSPCDKGSKNNPLPGGLISEVALGKRILWDWVSYTFDTLEYQEVVIPGIKKSFITIANTPTNDAILNTLLFILGVDSPVNWKEMDQNEYAVNNFRFSITVGEFININFAGPKSTNDRRTTQVLLKGQGCREFVEFRRRDSQYPFVELFSYLRTLGGHFKRNDLAIDDFTGKELNIYDLQEHISNKWFVSSFQSAIIFKSLDFRGGIFSKGYSATFGTSGSSQYQQYDKNLERSSQNYETFGTDVWYRHEMRFVDDKADKIVDEYLKVMLDPEKFDDKTRVSKFAMGALRGMIEFKKPDQCINLVDDYSWGSVKNSVSDADVLPEWLAFTRAVEATDMRSHSKVEKSIDRTERYVKRSLMLIFSELLLCYGDEYNQQHFMMALQGLEKMDNRSLEAVNKWRVEKGLKRLTMDDVEEMKKKFLDELTLGNIRVVVENKPY
jgi:hypothetical protein